MAAQSTDLQTFSLQGEVVEIREDFGQRLAKVVFTAPVLIDITADALESIHLGDRVSVHGWFGIEKEAS